MERRIQWMRSHNSCATYQKRRHFLRPSWTWRYWVESRWWFADVLAPWWQNLLLDADAILRDLDLELLEWVIAWCCRWHEAQAVGMQMKVVDAKAILSKSIQLCLKNNDSFTSRWLKRWKHSTDSLSRYIGLIRFKINKTRNKTRKFHRNGSIQRTTPCCIFSPRARFPCPFLIFHPSDASFSRVFVQHLSWVVLTLPLPHPKSLVGVCAKGF